MVVLLTKVIERLDVTVVSFVGFVTIGVAIFDFLIGVCCRFSEVVVRMGSLDGFGADNERLLLLDGCIFEFERRQGSLEGRTVVSVVTFD
jgi:hypothetical protein